MTELSLIVPCYCEEATVFKTVTSLLAFMDSWGVAYEIVVVVDGSDDRTLENVSKIRHGSLKVLSYEKNRGKGYAIRYGALAAVGEYVGYIDADSNIDPDVLKLLYEAIRSSGAHIAYPDKFRLDSSYRTDSFRKTMSRIYAAFVKALFRLPVSDTQSGAKIYSKEVVKKIMPACAINGFAFEIEIFRNSMKAGLGNFVSVPVRITRYSQGGASWREIWNVMFDTIKLFFK